MRFLLPTLLATLALAACGSDEPSPSSSGSAALADLTITVDPDGDGSTAAKTMQLTCKEPTDSQACGAAAGISEADLAPTRGGDGVHAGVRWPGAATIKGTIRGNPVDAQFARTRRV